jgi:hypothetical protein
VRAAETHPLLSLTTGAWGDVLQINAILVRRLGNLYVKAKLPQFFNSIFLNFAETARLCFDLYELDRIRSK